MKLFSFVKKLPISQKIVAFILSLYFVVWAISSPLIKYFANPLLIAQGLSISSAASISYNPFLTQVTVSDLKVFKDDEKVLSAQKLIVRITLFRLLFDEIAVSKLTLNDGFLSIKQTEKQLIIAGIDVKQNGDKDNQAVTANTPVEKDHSAVSPYYISLPKLTFNNVNIEVNNQSKPHHISLNKLVINDLLASKQSQQASISIDSIIDEAKITLTADAQLTQGIGDIHSELSISDYPVNTLAPYVNDLSELSGLFSLTSKQTISLAPEQVKLHIAEAELSNKNLIVDYQKQFFTLENFHNDLMGLVLTLENGELIELAGSSQLSMENANIYYQEASQKLAHFEQLTVADISFHLEPTPTIKIASLLVDNIVASKNDMIDLPPMAQLKQLSITDIFLNEKHIDINKVILDTLTADIIVSKEKDLANLVTLPVTKSEQEEIKQIEETLEKEINAPEAGLLISLGELSFINDNQIILVDNSVEPVKERKLYIDTLHLGALSNSKDMHEQKTPFEFTGRSNKYAHFEFKGFTQPFAKQPIHHLQGFLKELSLPAVSRYMKQAMQMELKSGQLNTNIDVTLTGEQLGGNVTLLLQGLETAIADSNEAGALIDQGALPFNMALGMLKDSHGDVELDVPLSGSTSDPEFGMSSIMTLITQKAIWMATKNYVITTFVPYANIVSAAMTVGEFALKLRFDDLIYQSKQIEPNEAQQAYLQAFIALMQDKKDTRVNICAISTPADIGLVAGSTITDKKDINRLKAIAVEREHAFKDYIIKHGQIESSRLLLCSPQIDSNKGAVPRIALSV